MAKTNENSSRSKRFSEAEAAEQLGLSQSEFRTLVRLVADGEISSDPVFRESDLILLRVMASSAAQRDLLTLTA